MSRFIFLLAFLPLALNPVGLGFAAPERLIINGHEVQLEHPLLALEGEAVAGAAGAEEEKGKGLLAPLEELSPYLGAELRREDRGYILRFGLGEEARLPQAGLHLQAGVSYFPLEELAGAPGGEIAPLSRLCLPFRPPE
jgi:hypothetical protein